MDVFSGYYKKSVDERIKLLKEFAGLTSDEVSVLEKTGSLSPDIADRMIENVVGSVHLPLGICTNFKINGKEYAVPMAVEEPSIIAAASNAAKLSLPEGFTADADEPIMMGQVQITNVKNPETALSVLRKHKKEILDYSKEFAKGMEKYGGGVKDFEARILETIRGKMIICEFYIDVRDAMGANTINTVLEKTAPFIKEIIGGTTRLRILTNLAVKRKAVAKAVWKKDKIGEEAIEGILDGYAFADADIYRCATHNKGIMNGIDAVALATGNDWRAVEAGAHAYAAMNGYSPLTKYSLNKNGDLEGLIELPLSVGTVGGAINTLPTAKIALKILKVKTARELSMVMACAGLANSFAALKALSTEGIQKGHMRLHARNIAVIAGAKKPEEIDFVSKKLAEESNYSVDFAKKILKEMKK
ncbi:hydroxymethylglutaryl-CoA reductase, degradative [Candidatus Micrarchaeota archaeon]|nr:hydroxymethylglutaryl-CoA reductase, degradative [Candidatus Micrarchaeota archaeon]